MISAGKTIDPKREQNEMLCGRTWLKSVPEGEQEWAEVELIDAKCEATVSEAYDKYTEGLNEEQLKYFDTVMLYAVSQANFNCVNSLEMPDFKSFNAGKITLDEFKSQIESFAACVADHVNPDADPAEHTFVLSGKTYTSYESMLEAVRDLAIRGIIRN